MRTVHQVDLIGSLADVVDINRDAASGLHFRGIGPYRIRTGSPSLEGVLGEAIASVEQRKRARHMRFKRVWARFWDAVDALEGRILVLYEAQSPADEARPAVKACVDPVSTRNLLTRNLAGLLGLFGDEEFLSDLEAHYVFLPYGPVPYPWQFRAGVPTLALPELAEEGGFFSSAMAPEGAPGVGNYEFAPHIFEADLTLGLLKAQPDRYAQTIAERFGGRKTAFLEHAEYEACVAREILAAQYAKVFRRLKYTETLAAWGKDGFPVYATLNGTGMKIFRRIPKYLDAATHHQPLLVGGESGPMPPNEITSLGLAHPSALARLLGHIRKDFLARRGRAPRQSATPRRLQIGPLGRLEHCPDYQYVLCADKCRYRRDITPCAAHPLIDGLSTEEKTLLWTGAVRRRLGITRVKNALGWLASDELVKVGMWRASREFLRLQEELREKPWQIPPPLSPPPPTPLDGRHSATPDACALSALFSLRISDERQRELLRELYDLRPDLVKRERYTPDFQDQASLFGTLVHRICLGHAEGLMEYERWIPWVGRSAEAREYAEREFVTALRVGGQPRTFICHPDAFFFVGDCDLVVLDYKTTWMVHYPRPKHLYQELAYGLSLQHAFNRQGNVYCVLICSPFIMPGTPPPEVVDEAVFRRQKIYIAKFAPNDPAFGEVQSLLAEKFSIEERLLTDLSFARAYKRQNEERRHPYMNGTVCGTCYHAQKSLCDGLLGGVLADTDMPLLGFVGPRPVSEGRPD